MAKNVTRLISKAALLAHHSEAEEYEIEVGGRDEVEYDEEGAETGREHVGGDYYALPLRRLNDRQWGQIEEMQSRGVHIKGSPDFDDEGNPVAGQGTEMDIDIQEQARSGAQARRMAVAWGLAYEDDKGNPIKTKPEEVGEIRDPGLVAAIYDKVMEISGVSEEAQQNAARFRKDEDGSGDGDAPSDGDEDSGEPSGGDAATDGVPERGAA